MQFNVEHAPLHWTIEAKDGSIVVSGQIIYQENGEVMAMSNGGYFVSYGVSVQDALQRMEEQIYDWVKLAKKLNTDPRQLPKGLYLR